MKKAYLSIDLGGTNIKAAIADEEMELLGEAQTPTESHEGPDGVLDRIANLVNGLADEHGMEIASLGMGVPGFVDPVAGVTKFLVNLPTQWREVEVSKILGGKLGCPVYVLNDARLATLGELRFGYGKEPSVSTMIMFTLGTGIGGGVAIDKKLRLGPLGSAGEIGHMTIVPDGPPCGCGSRGCLETLLSGPALTGKGVWLMESGRAPKLHEITGGDLAKVSPKTMAEAVKAGDESVKRVVTEAAEYLGVAIASVTTLLHPDTIVLTGGVAHMGDLIIDPAREVLRDRVRMFPTDDIQIVVSKLGSLAGQWGGIALAKEGVPLT